MRGYFPLIRKDSVTHIHGLGVYVKDGLPFVWDLFLETSRILNYAFDWLYFFFHYRWPSSSLCTFFNSISFNIDEVLPINLSTTVFVFGDFNVHYKDYLTYSGGTDRPGKLCYNFSTLNDLIQIVNFPTWILTMTLTVLLLWIYFFLLTLVFVLQWLALQIFIILLSQFPLIFQ